MLRKYVLHLDAEARRQLALHLTDEAAGFALAHRLALRAEDEVDLLGAQQQVVEVIGIDAVFLAVGGQPEGLFEFVGHEGVASAARGNHAFVGGEQHDTAEVEVAGFEHAEYLQARQGLADEVDAVASCQAAVYLLQRVEGVDIVVGLLQFGEVGHDFGQAAGGLPLLVVALQQPAVEHGGGELCQGGYPAVDGR